MANAKFGNPNTKHGKLQLPNAKLLKYSESKNGGGVKNSKMSGGLAALMGGESMAAPKASKAAGAAKKGWKPPKKFSSGGSVRGSGCESKGKTKGRFI